MRLSGHGITIELPGGWDGQIYRRPAAEPTLHAASFPLPPHDGDFGSGATGTMPAVGAFVALKEYQAGPRLVPGQGLFAARTLPLPLEPRRFHPRSLQVGRAGQAGFQHFFTMGRRPLCLYAVISGLATATRASAARDHVSQLNQILSSLQLETS